MANYLKIDTVMDEPRQIVVVLGGRKILPFLSTKSREITIDIPNPSIRKAQQLRQKYYAFVNAWIQKDEKVLAKISLDIVADAFKSYRPVFTKWWVLRNLNDQAFTQILEFILAPTREKEEEYLKNVMALQKMQS